MNNPKVSVVIPLFNKGQYIARALDSVLAQTIQDFEVVIVDDGSTDNAEEIIKRYSDSRIRYISQQNSGVSIARNAGIKEARADIICFLDADDEYLPKFIETVLSLRDKHPQAGIYSTAYSIVETDGKEVCPNFIGIPPFPWEGILPNYFRSTLGAQPVTAITAAIPKTVLLGIGGFPVGVSFGEDLITWFRIAMKYPVAFSSYAGAIYYRDAVNRVSGLYTIADDYICIMQDVRESDTLSKENSDCIDMMMDKQYLSAAANCLILGDKDSARRYLSKVKTEFYFNKKRWWSFWASVPTTVLNIALSLRNLRF